MCPARMRHPELAAHSIRGDKGCGCGIGSEKEGRRRPPAGERLKGHQRGCNPTLVRLGVSAAMVLAWPCSAFLSPGVPISLSDPSSLLTFSRSCDKTARHGPRSPKVALGEILSFMLTFCSQNVWDSRQEHGVVLLQHQVSSRS